MRRESYVDTNMQVNSVLPASQVHIVSSSVHHVPYTLVLLNTIHSV
jgi:hypothetical protein